METFRGSSSGDDEIELSLIVTLHPLLKTKWGEPTIGEDAWAVASPEKTLDLS